MLRTLRRPLIWITVPAALCLSATFLVAPPTDVQQPGTQPGQILNLDTLGFCSVCHGHYNQQVEPLHTWRGSMMAHAARDPVFWGAMAVSEQDFPGAGDFCLRCHTPRGWLEGRAVPSSGSSLQGYDEDGVECEICHRLANPDQSELTGVQNAPFIAHNGGTPPEGYYGSGMYVLNGSGDKLGPYANPAALHGFQQSQFHRQSEMCGTCHDVSNPVVGDLAPNNGAPQPLPPGSFSGTPGAPVAQKAAFNNFPFQYGIVERTFSEHMASAWPTTRVSDFTTLPAELQDGSIAQAYDAALIAGAGGDYEDGTTRHFTCQSCHMRPARGFGCSIGNPPLRKDLPVHDLTGGNYWTPDAILYMNQQNTLRLGGSLTQEHIDGLRDGKQRALDNLEQAASLTVTGNNVRVVNLTGHKLISGYPEGRRMWLRMVWQDIAGNLLREDGAYGPITANIGGTPTQVQTLLDLSGANTRIYETKPGISQDWAQGLLNLGLPSTLPLAYDRATGASTLTLGQLAAMPPGTEHDTFHFVLNNTILTDTRIPPYGMSFDEAQRRNTLPVPATQFGNPGPGGMFNYWDDVPLNPPTGAAFGRIELLYQPTSWEYVQFLALANNGSVPFLANVGADLLDAWLNTGMAHPHVMASAEWCRLPGTGEDLELLTEVNGGGNGTTCAKRAAEGDQVSFVYRSPLGTFQGGPAALVLELYPEGSPPTPIPGFPGIQLSHSDLTDTVFALPMQGVTVNVQIPPGMGGTVARAQAIALSLTARNGLFASSDAHEIHLQ